MALYPNRRSGSCTTCKTQVPAQAGFINKNAAGRWDVFHNSDKCIPAALQASHTKSQRKELTADGELYFPYDVDALDLLRSFPPSRDRDKKTWDGEKKCRNVSIEPEDRARVLELCEKLGITVADELKEIPQDLAVDQAFLRCDSIPTLRSYQRVGVEFLARHRKAILADDMGLGKTLQALLALDSSMGMLVVCPQSVKGSWAAETRKWRPDLTPEIMEGRGSFRFPLPGEVVITNFEILPKWLMPVVLATTEDGREIKGANIPDLPSFRKSNPKNVVLVVDEAQRAKNYRTQLHKKIKELGRICGRAWQLSGTPIDNKPTDLWGVLQAAHLEREVFGGWKGFCRCFQASKGGYGGSYVWGSPLPEVPERLRRVMLRRLKENVLKELPPTIWKDVYVPVTGARFTTQLNKVYDRVQAILENGDLPSFEELSQVRARLAESRIPAMLDMVEDFEDADEPLVVFSAYKAPINELAKREGWAVITGDVPAARRQQIIEDFQAGKYKGIGLTIAAGGVGITLTHASNMLFVDLDWVPSKNAQAVDRIRRLGQSANSIQIIRMASDHPVDRRVQQILAQKMDLINRAIEGEIKYQRKEDTGIKTESQEDFDARMAVIKAAAQKVERQQAKDRFNKGLWLQGERAKAAKSPEISLTPKVAVTLRDALSFMLNNCDGAQARDNVGFNKPDAGRARILVTTGLTTDAELRTAERMLSRYRRQLAEKYPDLFA